MDFSEKSKLCNDLSAAEHVAADRALLQSVQPSDSLLYSVEKGVDLDKQLLWVLLEHCSVDDIKNNRNNYKTPVVVAPNTLNKTKQTTQSTSGASVKKKSKKKKNIGILSGINSITKLFRKPQ